MLHKLNQYNFPRVRDLFASLAASQPMCNAVLERVSPGAVYVDDPAAPRTAYLQTFIGSEQEPQWGFLAGDPSNAAFNHELNRTLFGREIIHPDAPLVFCTCDSPDWLPALEAVFAPSPPVPASRRHYVARAFHQDWRRLIPEGFVVEPLNPDLLQRPGLSVPDEVRQTLAKWERIAGPCFADYGFVAIEASPRAAQVAAWATVDFVAGGMGDLGMFTLDEYRKRGLAYITTSAAIEHGLAHGLRQICWTCMEDNPGSIRTAERLGLERVEDYTLYVLAFDPLEVQSMLAYAALEAGRAGEALAMLEGIIASGKEFPSYVLFDAARARALLGEKAAALTTLQALADRGSKNTALHEETPEFESLLGLPGWQDFIRKVQENSNAK
jgi:RimJ/RimL family protein N-acetyltransferase